jgi:hypothetical protein
MRAARLIWPALKKRSGEVIRKSVFAVLAAFAWAGLAGSARSEEVVDLGGGFLAAARRY